MIDQGQFFDRLRAKGVNFFTGVPDTLLNDFCLYLSDRLSCQQHVIAANEGNAIALAAGYHLATDEIPLVYMQNSGIGNATNPLLSLTNAEVYSIPMVLVIGWRGDPAVPDWAQHQKQGVLTTTLLELFDIPYQIIGRETSTALDSIDWAVREAKNRSSPVALLAKKGVLAQVEKETTSDLNSPYLLTREDAMTCIINCVPNKSIFVATTGRATRELHAIRRSTGSTHERDFLNVGAMGHASSIAAGVALAKRDRLIVCFDGDASAIMHLGAFTTQSTLHLSNLLHVVLNNGVHESVGGQASAGMAVDLTSIAKSCGYRVAGSPVESATEIQNALASLASQPGEAAAFLEVRIRKGMRHGIPPLRINPIELKELFVKANLSSNH